MMDLHSMIDPATGNQSYYYELLHPSWNWRYELATMTIKPQMWNHRIGALLTSLTGEVNRRSLCGNMSRDNTSSDNTSSNNTSSSDTYDTLNSVSFLLQNEVYCKMMMLSLRVVAVCLNRSRCRHYLCYVDESHDDSASDSLVVCRYWKDALAQLLSDTIAHQYRMNTIALGFIDTWTHDRDCESRVAYTRAMLSMTLMIRC